MFFPAMERTKDRRGTAPMSACAERALIVTFPPKPPFYGGRPLENLELASGGSDNKTIWSFLPRALGPTGSEICEYLRCTHTAYSGRTRVAGQNTKAKRGSDG